jgi:solute carrier family 35, member F5
VSLIGEMIQYGRYSSFVYWLGAIIVFISFVFVSNESREETEEPQEPQESTASQQTAPV